MSDETTALYDKNSGLLRKSSEVPDGTIHHRGRKQQILTPKMSAMRRPPREHHYPGISLRLTNLLTAWREQQLLAILQMLLNFCNGKVGITREHRIRNG